MEEGALPLQELPSLELEVDIDACVHTEHIFPNLQHQEETLREGRHHGYQAAASLVP